MAESYSIISPDVVEPEAVGLAQLYYSDIEFASQLSSEFAAAESSNSELTTNLSNAHNALQLIIEHNTRLKTPSSSHLHRSVRQPAWPRHPALLRFDLPLHRLTTQYHFFKKWVPRFVVLRGSRMYYSNGKGGHPDSLEGSLAFMRSNPTLDGRHCMDLIGCKVIPCHAAVDGQAFAFKIKFPSGRQAARDVCLAAADDVTRQRCVRIIEAASAGGASSSLSDIASSAALTPGLFMMRSVLAVNAVLAALGRTPAGGLDLPSLKAAGFTAAEAKAAGFTAAEVKAEGYDFASAQSAGYHLLPLIAAFGYETVAASGCDMSCILRDGSNLYATPCLHKVDDNTLFDDSKFPNLAMCSFWSGSGEPPEGWVWADHDADAIRVCRAHPWKCDKLILGPHGDEYGTSKNPSYECPVGSAYRMANYSEGFAQAAEDVHQRKRFTAYDHLLRLRRPCTSRFDSVEEIRSK